MASLKLYIKIVALCSVCLISVSSFDPDSDFIRTHNCKVNKTETVDDGFASYYLHEVNCINLEPSSFPSAICSSTRCREPINGKPLSGKRYEPKEVLFKLHFDSRLNGKFTKSLTIACRCVKVEKLTKRRKGGRGRKGGKGKDKKSRRGKKARKAHRTS
uniref:uncharacterized protein LOC120338200 isoform X2 n=1 Tax=Styela clava TaxID=7725 RepID=UPI001939B819|nr:uncharacterized protein LOC120338200 isoform X2 [Styela clava]